MTTRTEPGVPSDNTTLLEVLAEYGDAGYGADVFCLPEAVLRCGRCGMAQRARRWHLDAMRKLEGASDPADTQAVLALHCPNCHRGGTAVIHLGADADTTTVELIIELSGSLPIAPPPG
jgi:hypothetical protein